MERKKITTEIDNWKRTDNGLNGQWEENIYNIHGMDIREIINNRWENRKRIDNR